MAFTTDLRKEADTIVAAAIAAAQPDEAVAKALRGADFGSGRVVLVAAGKGAWQMAHAASGFLGSRIDTGIVITKYGHCKGPIANLTLCEAGHPIPDENSFAQLCAPAHVFSIVLSDILGDPLDMIASGPAYPDLSTAAQAQAIAQKYQLPLTDTMRQLLAQETPKTLDNVETHITGSVRQLCAAAADAACSLHYEPLILTDCLSCEAREAGVFLSNMVRYTQKTGKQVALIAGGETVVHLTGHGKGGRNQELALAAAPGIAGLDGCAVFSVGSDGTDGPTDAAGGYVDGRTQAQLRAQGCDIFATLADNDAYHALQKCGGLILTGPTGTNVNDVSVALIRAN